MKRLLHLCLSLLLALQSVSCIYPFEVEAGQGDSQLVVEGTILSDHYSVFTLSRSKSISNLNRPTESLRAKWLVVESEDGTRFPGEIVTEANVGYKNFQKFNYIADTRKIDTDKRCRVVIMGLDSTRYTSEWVSFMATPEIDSVYYEIPEEKNRLTILVDTHDDDEENIYYSWTYTEDWEFHSRLYADVYYDKKTRTILPFTDGENIYHCWGHYDSPDVQFFSTEKLSKNLVSRHQITRAYVNSRRLQYLYAIEVRQRSVSKEEFKYWSVLLQNSENAGGLFSPMPNDLKGNITSDKEGEDVIGYIGAGAVRKQRIFIDCSRLDLFHSWPKLDKVQSNDPEQWWELYHYQAKLPYEYDEVAGTYSWDNGECIDCRIYGSKNKPDFWPNLHK